MQAFARSAPRWRHFEMANKPKTDSRSLALPGIPSRMGRPRTGKAMTPAQRQKRYRARQKALRLALAVTLSPSERNENS
jgi:hypothetical protein